VNLATYTFSGTVAASPAPTISRFNSDLVPPASPSFGGRGGNWGNDRGYYGLGVVTFTSGALNGQQRQVESSSLRDGSGNLIQTGTLKFSNPWPTPPVAGSTFTVELGCDKSQLQCLYKFSNLIANRGFWTIPRSLGR
jgi:hypothetical protein